MPGIVKYLSNVTKSVAYATIDVAKDLNPVIVDAVDTNKDAMTVAFKSIKNLDKIVSTAMKTTGTSKMGELAVGMKNNILEDLKNGTFYNKKRMEKAQEQVMKDEMGFGDDDFGDGGFDDDDLGFGDDDYGDDEDYSSEEYMADAMDDVGERASGAVNQMLIRTSEYQVEAQRESTSKMMAQQAAVAASIHSDLSVLNTNISGIMQFNSGAAATHFENSKLFYETQQKLMEEQTAVLKEMLDLQKSMYTTKTKSTTTKVTIDDIFTSEGVINLAEYYKYVQQNAKTAGEDFTDMFEMLNDNGMFEQAAANPLGFALQGMIGSFVSKKAKKAFRDFNDALAGSMSTLLLNLGKQRDSDNPIMALLGSTFGIDLKIKKRVNTSKYNKGPVPWNGIDHKALTEVIPTLLTKIHSAISGEKEIRYNYEEGKFMTYDDIRKDFDRKMNRFVNSANSTILPELNKQISRISFKSEIDRENFIKDLEHIMSTNFERGSYFNPNKKSETAASYGINHADADYNFEIIRQMYKNIAPSKMLKNNQDLIDAITSRNKYLERLEESGDSPFLSVLDRSDANSRYGEKKAAPIVQKFNDTNNLLGQIFAKLGTIDTSVNRITSTIMFINKRKFPDFDKYNKRSSWMVDKTDERLKAIMEMQARYGDEDSDLYKAAQYEMNRRAWSKRVDSGIQAMQDHATAIGGKVTVPRVDSNGQIVMEQQAVNTKQASPAGTTAKPKQRYESKMGLTNYTDAETSMIYGTDIIDVSMLEQDPDTWLNAAQKAKNPTERLKAMFKGFDYLRKQPAEFLGNVLNKVDNQLYKLLFGDDKNGDLQESSIFERMTEGFDEWFEQLKMKTDDRFNDIRDALGESDISGKFKALAKSLFGVDIQNWSDSFKKAMFGDTETTWLEGFGKVFREGFSDMWKGVKDAFADPSKAISENVKGVLTEEGEKKKKANDDIDARRAALRGTWLERQRAEKQIEKEQKKLQEEGGAAINEYAEDKNVTGQDDPTLPPITKAAEGGIFDIKKRQLFAVSPKEKVIILPPKGATPATTSENYRKESTLISKFKDRAKGITQHIFRRAEGDDGTGQPLTEETAEERDSRHREVADKLREMIEGGSEDGSDIVKYVIDSIGKDEFKQFNKLLDKEISAKLLDLFTNSKEKLTRDDYKQASLGQRMGDELKNAFNSIMDSKAVTTAKDKFTNYFGEKAGSQGGEVVKDTVNNFSKYFPRMASGGVAGIGLSLMLGLAGGPLLAAAVGSGAGLLSKSSALQEFLFGKEILDDEGNSTGQRDGTGIISKDISKNATKYFPGMSKGAIVGGLTSILPFVPGGPIAGILVGSAIGFSRTNEQMKEAIWGEGKFLDRFGKQVKEKLPRIGLGALAGLVMGPFGGVASNLLLGSALGFASDTNKFKDLIFGTEDLNGKRAGGLVGFIKDATKIPIEGLKNLWTDVRGWFKEDILNPIARGIKPFIQQFKNIGNWFKDIITSGFKTHIFFPIGQALNDKIIQPLERTVGKYLLKPLFGFAKKIVSSPFRAFGALGGALERRQLRKEGAAGGSLSARITRRAQLDQEGPGGLKHVANRLTRGVSRTFLGRDNLFQDTNMKYTSSKAGRFDIMMQSASEEEREKILTAQELAAAGGLNKRKAAKKLAKETIAKSSISKILASYRAQGLITGEDISLINSEILKGKSEYAVSLIRNHVTFPEEDKDRMIGLIKAAVKKRNSIFKMAEIADSYAKDIKKKKGLNIFSSGAIRAGRSIRKEFENRGEEDGKDFLDNLSGGLKGAGDKNSNAVAQHIDQFHTDAVKQLQDINDNLTKFIEAASKIDRDADYDYKKLGKEEELEYEKDPDSEAPKKKPRRIRDFVKAGIKAPFRGIGFLARGVGAALKTVPAVTRVLAEDTSHDSENATDFFRNVQANGYSTSAMKAYNSDEARESRRRAKIIRSGVEADVRASLGDKVNYMTKDELERAINKTYTERYEARKEHQQNVQEFRKNMTGTAQERYAQYMEMMKNRKGAKQPSLTGESAAQSRPREFLESDSTDTISKTKDLSDEAAEKIIDAARALRESAKELHGDDDHPQVVVDAVAAAQAAAESGDYNAANGVLGKRSKIGFFKKIVKGIGTSHKKRKSASKSVMTEHGMVKMTTNDQGEEVPDVRDSETRDTIERRDEAAETQKGILNHIKGFATSIGEFFGLGKKKEEKKEGGFLSKLLGGAKGVAGGILKFVAPAALGILGAAGVHRLARTKINVKARDENGNLIKGEDGEQLYQKATIAEAVSSAVKRVWMGDDLSGNTNGVWFCVKHFVKDEVVPTFYDILNGLKDTFYNALDTLKGFVPSIANFFHTLWMGKDLSGQSSGLWFNIKDFAKNDIVPVLKTGFNLFVQNIPHLVRVLVSTLMSELPSILGGAAKGFVEGAKGLWNRFTGKEDSEKDTKNKIVPLDGGYDVGSYADAIDINSGSAPVYLNKDGTTYEGKVNGASVSTSYTEGNTESGIVKSFNDAFDAAKNTVEPQPINSAALSTNTSKQVVIDELISNDVRGAANTVDIKSVGGSSTDTSKQKIIDILTSNEVHQFNSPGYDFSGSGVMDNINSRQTVTNQDEIADQITASPAYQNASPAVRAKVFPQLMEIWDLDTPFDCTVGQILSDEETILFQIEDGKTGELVNITGAQMLMYPEAANLLGIDSTTTEEERKYYESREGFSANTSALTRTVRGMARAALLGGAGGSGIKFYISANNYLFNGMQRLLLGNGKFKLRPIRRMMAGALKAQQMLNLAPAYAARATSTVARNLNNGKGLRASFGAAVDDFIDDNENGIVAKAKDAVNNVRERTSQAAQAAGESAQDIAQNVVDNTEVEDFLDEDQQEDLAEGVQERLEEMNEERRERLSEEGLSARERRAQKRDAKARKKQAKQDAWDEFADVYSETGSLKEAMRARRNSLNASIEAGDIQQGKLSSAISGFKERRAEKKAAREEWYQSVRDNNYEISHDTNAGGTSSRYRDEASRARAEARSNTSSEAFQQRRNDMADFRQNMTGTSQDRYNQYMEQLRNRRSPGGSSATEAASDIVDSIGDRIDDVLDDGIETRGSNEGPIKKIMNWSKNMMEKFFKNNTVIEKATNIIKKAVGKGEVAKDKIASTLLKISDKLIAKATSGLAKKGAKFIGSILARFSAAVGTAGLATITTVVGDFLIGLKNADAIIGVLNPTFTERLIAGIVNAILNNIIFGILEAQEVINTVTEFLEALGVDFSTLRARQAEVSEEVRLWNEAHPDEQYTEYEYLMKDKIETKIGNFVEGIMDTRIMAPVKGVMDFGGEVIGGVFNGVKAVGGGLLDAGKNVLGGIGSAIGKAADGDLAGAGGELLKGAGKGFLSVGKAFGNGAYEVGKGVFNGGKGILNGIGKLVTGDDIFNMDEEEDDNLIPDEVYAPTAAAKDTLTEINESTANASAGGSSTAEDAGRVYAIDGTDVTGYSEDELVRDEDGNIIGAGMDEDGYVKSMFIGQSDDDSYASGGMISDENAQLIDQAREDINASIPRRIDDLNARLDTMFAVGHDRVEKKNTPQVLFDALDSMWNTSAAKIQNFTTKLPTTISSAVKGLSRFLAINLGYAAPEDKDIDLTKIVENQNYMNRRSEMIATSSPFYNILGGITGSNSNNAATQRQAAQQVETQAAQTSYSSESGSNSIANTVTSSTSGKKSFASGLMSGVSKIVKGITGFFGIGGKGSGLDDETTLGDGGDLAEENFVSQKYSSFANRGFTVAGDSEKSTVADSGCAPASATMAINTFANSPKPITMQEAMKDAIKYKHPDGGVTADYFVDEFAKYGVGSAFVTDQNKDKNTVITKNLSNNIPVILMGKDDQNKSKSQSPFGPRLHYVVATGLADKGKSVYINDPEARKPKIKYPLAKILSSSTLGVIPVSKGGKDIPKGLLDRVKRSLRYYSATGKYSSDSIEWKVWDGLRSHGYSEVATAAAMGNIYAESGFKPDAIEKGNNIGFGLIQWSYGRRTAIENYARKKGVSPADIGLQIEYLIYEIESGKYFTKSSTAYDGHSYTITDWRDTTDLDRATTAFMACFERPKASKCHLDTRINAARGYYKEFTGTEPSGTSYSPDGTGDGENGTEESSGSFLDELLGVWDKLGRAYGLLSGDSSGGTNEEGSGDSTFIDDGTIKGYVSSNPEYAQQQKALVYKMKSKEGQLKYAQGNAKYPGSRNPEDGSGDCSSTVQWAYKNVLGVDPGSSTATQVSDSDTYTAANSLSDESKLQLGDLLLKKGHVEMYYGDGKMIGHGGGNHGSVPGPTVKKLGGGEYNTVRRWVGFKNGGPSVMSDSNGTEATKLDDETKKKKSETVLDVVTKATPIARVKASGDITGFEEQEAINSKKQDIKRNLSVSGAHDGGYGSGIGKDIDIKSKEYDLETDMEKDSPMLEFGAMGSATEKSTTPVYQYHTTTKPINNTTNNNITVNAQQSTTDRLLEVVIKLLSQVGENTASIKTICTLITEIAKKGTDTNTKSTVDSSVRDGIATAQALAVSAMKQTAKDSTSTSVEDLIRNIEAIAAQ